MKTEQMATYVTPPTAGATPGAGITCIGADTTSRTYDLDTFTGLFDRFIDVMADGGKVYVLFDNDSTGGIDQTVAGAAGAATGVADGTTEAVPWPLADGVPQSFILQKTTHRYLHIKAASGTPQLRIRPSCPKSLQDR